MEAWTQWYSKYIPGVQVFPFGLDGLPYNSMFGQHFRHGNVRCIGRVARYAVFKNKERLNSSFRDFCSKNKIPLPNAYRQAQANIDAGYISAAKYDKAQPVLDEGAWALAGEWTKQHFQHMSNSKVRSEEECISAMDMTTSPGFPWTQRFTSKKQMMRDAEAMRVVTDYWEALGKPGVLPPLWTCAQKRELRDVEKLAENSLRTFTASPFEFSVSANRLCLDANERFYDGAIWRSFSAVGKTKFLSGWDTMARKLLVHPNMYELDESQFDSSLFRAALFGQRDIRWEFLSPDEQTDENRRRLWELYDSIVNSYIVMEDGTLVQKTTGNPSGSSNTVVDNTMILFRLFCYAWIILCKENGIVPTYQHFQKHVEALLYGDDNTYSCSDEVKAWFTPANISRVWTGIGVTTKTPNWNAGDLNTVSFLSNRFVYSDFYSMWFPCPNTERILSSVCWGASRDDVRYHFLRVCALRMDSYWNVEVRDILSKYLDYLRREHAHELVGELRLSADDLPITIQQIFALWRSDSWIEALYSGVESKAGQDNTSSSLNFSLLLHSLSSSFDHPCFSSLSSLFTLIDNAAFRSPKG